MMEKLDFMVRFWQLRARHDALGDPLSPIERAALLSLVRLMSSESHLPQPGPPPPSDDGLPVQLTSPGGFLSAELRLIAAEGLLLASASSLAPGHRTIVRLADAVSGVEYALPCTVAWRHVGRPSAMALRIDGAPVRTTFAIPERGMWRTLFPWGEPAFASAQ